MTVKPVHGRVFGAWVCEQLGIDPNTVTQVEIVASPSDVTTVEVTIIPERDLMEQIVRRYVLVEVGE